VISHIALDIGGSLIKLVYFSPDAPPADGEGGPGAAGRSGNGNGRSGGDTPQWSCKHCGFAGGVARTACTLCCHVPQPAVPRIWVASGCKIA